ncbi:single-stranded DNA-binding protein [Sphingomonas sp. LR61]
MAEFAEHVAGSLTKGSRVIAQGRLRQRSYQDREGQQRTSIELEVDEIGPSLRYATAQITRAAGGGGGRGQVGGGNGGGQQGGGNGGWNNNGGGNASAGGQSDEPWSPQGGQQGGGNAQSNDVWSTPGGNFDDETPF